MKESIVLGGGCFWCLDALYRRIKGVTSVISGYSGGGRSMIEAYEAGSAPPMEFYALGLKHKHIPENMRYTGLTRRPLFVPSVITAVAPEVQGLTYDLYGRPLYFGVSLG